MHCIHRMTCVAALILSVAALNATASTMSAIDDPLELHAISSLGPAATTVVAVPEPSSLALLAAPGLILARRRRA